MRVLHVDAGRHWRGGQRQVLLLAMGLRADGDEPLIAAPAESPLMTRARARGIAATAVTMRADWDLPAAQRLRALIRTWTPDVVHAHDARAHALSMAALIGRPDVPLVVTRRVTFVPKGRLKYGPRVARFIAISNAVRDSLMAGGVPADRISLVYSGIPMPQVGTPRDWRAECGWPTETVLCGVVGAMTAEKGLDALEHIAQRLPATVRERIRLVLLGGHSGGRCRIGGIEAFRAGFVDEIHAAMAGLDLLWHPSAAEGLGTAVLDAMALGVVPIAFAVGGLSEIIRDGVDGRLAPAGDVSAFAAAAAQLVVDPSGRTRLGAEARERARMFDASAMVAGTRAVYDEVVRSSTNAGATRG